MKNNLLIALIVTRPCRYAAQKIIEKHIDFVDRRFRLDEFPGLGFYPDHHLGEK